MKTYVTKGQLRNHLNAKFAEKESKIGAEIKELIDTKVDPIINSLLDDSKIKELGRPLIEELEKMEQKHPLLFSEDWELKNAISTIRFGIRISNRGFSRLKDKVQRAIKNPTDHFETGYTDLDKAVEQLRVDVAPRQKQLSDLRTLWSEVRRVIDNESKGPKAARTLEFLGIDLSGLETHIVENLPAVQKFSVNPCVINGDCKEAE